MSQFWAGTLIGAAIGFFAGIGASVIASYLWELGARRKAYNAASKLVGTWVAYGIQGRRIDTTPMRGAGLTVVSLKHGWWAADSRVLDVRSEDIDAVTGKKRTHDGAIVLNPATPWLAFRIDRYADSNEISQQQLLIDPNDCNTVLVFPDPTIATLSGNVYARHAWRRQPVSPP